MSPRPYNDKNFEQYSNPKELKFRLVTEGYRQTAGIMKKESIINKLIKILAEVIGVLERKDKKEKKI